jgi:hypothetical protein
VSELFDARRPPLVKRLISDDANPRDGFGDDGLRGSLGGTGDIGLVGVTGVSASSDDFLLFESLAVFAFFEVIFGKWVPASACSDSFLPLCTASACFDLFMSLLSPP